MFGISRDRGDHRQGVDVEHLGDPDAADAQIFCFPRLFDEHVDGIFALCHGCGRQGQRDADGHR
jgi:hypothetical protein